MSVDYELYRRLPGFVLGFHGCDRAVGEEVIAGKRPLETSSNEYDWLGTGIYFWENDPRRAMEFAEEAMKRPVSKGVIKDPFVVGAVIDLGLCLNLLDRESVEELGQAYEILRLLQDASNAPMPQNKGKERALRFLDRAVVEMVHSVRETLNKGENEGKYPPYDSVRGAFLEGDEVYPEAGFLLKNHIQLAIKNTKCIKGYFKPREL